ncbi:MAG: Antitoxin RelF [bacterium ADurb.Bin212]|nr:MAG: Antitoxin RelF [bacterium ADurb.Bin212]
MLQVNVDKILPVTEARDKFNQLVDSVEGTDDLYVLTKNGKPAAVVVGVNHLEKLTGEQNIQSIAAGAAASQFSDDSDQSDDTPNQPDDSQTETVFASADDAVASSSSSLATEDNTPLDLASPAPSAPSTEFQGAVSEPSPAPTTTEDDPIQPIPSDFSASIPTFDSSAETDSTESEDLNSQSSTNAQFSSSDMADPMQEENSEPIIDPFATTTPSPDTNAGFATEDDTEAQEDSNTISGQ